MKSKTLVVRSYWQLHHQALGRIVVALGLTELTTLVAIHAITGIEWNLCQSMFAGENFDKLLNILRAASSSKFAGSPIGDDFRKILSGLDALKEPRRKYIHTAWANLENPPIVRFRVVKPKGTNLRGLDVATVSVSELEEFAEQIHKASDDLVKFLSKQFNDLVVEDIGTQSR